jgi:ABC-type Fe3+/spermidine/putrescine transport system ATPase subunit
VRDFLGRTDKFNATIIAQLSDRRFQIVLDGTEIRLTTGTTGTGDYSVGKKVTACIRPEEIELSPDSFELGDNAVEGVVRTFLFLGDRAEARVSVGDGEVTALVPRGLHLKHGQRIFVRFPEEAISLWPL